MFILTGLVIGLFIFWAFAFRPNNTLSYGLAVFWLAALVAAGYWVAFPGMVKSANESFAVNLKPIPTLTRQPTTTPTPQPSASSLPASAVPATPAGTSTPVPPTLTLSPTSTPTIFATPLQENFVWAFIAADEGGGARLRDKPSFNGEVIRILDNKMMVRMMPVMKLNEKVWWAQVQTIDGTIGWMVHQVLITATPLPSATNTPKP